MQQLKDLADPRLIQGCLYCGAINPDTREHVPSKILLEKPFPENLSVVAACWPCNNSYSIDEEYVACIIACMMSGTTEPEKIKNSRVMGILSKKTALRSLIEQSKYTTLDSKEKFSFSIDHNRFKNVIQKLAIGHAVYELSLVFREEPKLFDWKLISSMEEDQKATFNAPQFIDLLGEVGSRNTQRIMVVDVLLQSTTTGELIRTPLILNDWVDVQEGVYRYHVVQSNNGVQVKIVLNEYIACEVHWDV